MNTSFNPLSFDRGLSAISTQSSGTVDPSLPKESKVVPSGDPVLSQLSALLDDPSLEQALLEALRPKLADLSILLPQSFGQLLRDIVSQADALAAGTADRNTRQIYEAVASLLHDELSLADQLAALRSQLLQA
jgi:hypothetical protein